VSGTTLRPARHDSRLLTPHGRNSSTNGNSIMRASFLPILAAAISLSTGAAAQVTVLTGATLIDGTGAAPQGNVTVVIESGRIRELGPSSHVTAPPGATVVDLARKFVVPGIINAHGHVGANREPQLRQYALYGVTTTTSMAFDPDDILQFKTAQKQGNLRGARVMTVKYRFMSAPQTPGSEYKTPEEARAKVDEIAASADLVKVWIDPQGGRHPRLSREFCAAVMEQARKHGKTTMAHVVELADARMIVDEGVNILAHNVRDQEIPDDFIATLKQRNVSVISTLGREEALFVFGDGPAFTDHPFFQKGLTPERLELLKTKKREEQANDPARPRWLRMFDTDKKNLKKLADAGVRIGFGTDSGGAPNRFFIQGFFEHRQMELMRDAGLTPMQIMQSFSKNNAELLRIDGDFGTLAKGKAADLLVLAKNPLDDITNMRTIEAVYLGGKKFE
jgi:imidazolonepropionase-like amidohydrolase